MCPLFVVLRRSELLTTTTSNAVKHVRVNIDYHAVCIAMQLRVFGARFPARRYDFADARRQCLQMDVKRDITLARTIAFLIPQNG